MLNESASKYTTTKTKNYIKDSTKDFVVGRTSTKAILLVNIFLIMSSAAYAQCIQLTQDDFTGSNPHNTDPNNLPTYRLVNTDNPWGNEWWLPLHTNTCYELTEDITTAYPIRVINYMPPEYLPSGIDGSERPYNPLSFSCKNHKITFNQFYYGAQLEENRVSANNNLLAIDPNSLQYAPTLILDGYVDAKDCTIQNGIAGLMMTKESTAVRFEILNPLRLGALLLDNTQLSESTIYGPYYENNNFADFSYGVVQYGKSRTDRVQVLGERGFNENTGEHNWINKDRFVNDGFLLKDQSTSTFSTARFVFDGGFKVEDQATANTVTVQDAGTGIYVSDRGRVMGSSVTEHRKTGVRASDFSRVINTVVSTSVCTDSTQSVDPSCQSEPYGLISASIYPTVGFLVSGNSSITGSNAVNNGIGFVVDEVFGSKTGIVSLYATKAEDNRHIGYYVQDGPVVIDNAYALRNGRNDRGTNNNWLSGFKIGDNINEPIRIFANNLISYNNYAVSGFSIYKGDGKIRNLYSCDNRNENPSGTRAEIFSTANNFMLEGSVIVSGGINSINSSNQELFLQNAQISNNCPPNPPGLETNPEPRPREQINMDGGLQ